MSRSLGTLSQQCAGLEAGEISSRELVGQALTRASLSSTTKEMHADGYNEYV